MIRLIRKKLSHIAVTAAVLSLGVAGAPAAAVAKPTELSCGAAVNQAGDALHAVKFSSGKLIKHLKALREIDQEITELRALQDAAPDEGKAQIQILINAAVVRYDARAEKVRLWNHEWSTDAKLYPRRMASLTRVVSQGGCSGKQRKQFRKHSEEFWETMAKVGRTIAGLY